MSTYHSVNTLSAYPSLRRLIVGIAAIALIACVGLLLSPTHSVAQKHVRDTTSTSPALTALGDATGVAAWLEPAAHTVDSSSTPLAVATVN
jgi:hypothetical protein